jgi:anti-sigma factor ChrR (cupin superfamily)
MAEEELEGQAALYALGALDAEEARAFESHLEEGCAACEAALREFELVAADLAFAAHAAEPPAHARSRLLALVSEEQGRNAHAETQARTALEESTDESTTDHAAVAVDEPAHAARQTSSGAGFLVVRAGEGEWRATADPGVSFKLLFVDRERSTVTTLVRMEPGARIRAHRHLGLEQCLVLEGDVRSGVVRMTTGDFNCSLPGSVHDELHTDGGALLLIVAPERYETLEPHAHTPV